MADLPLIVRPLLLEKRELALELGLRPSELSRLLRGYRLTPAWKTRLEAAVMKRCEDQA